jgi:hypothetical protein
MIIPDEIWAKKGRSIKKTWNALLRYFASQRLWAGSGVDLRVTPDGTWVSATSSHVWLHPFRVTLEGLRVKVSWGTINGDVPRIGKDWWRIDGTDYDYIPHTDGVPFLDLTKEAKDSGRSSIAIRIEVDPKTGTANPDRAESLTVIHLPDFYKPAKDEGEFVGYLPLAALYWSEKQVVRTRNVVHLNQSHAFIPGKEGRRGRHWFSAN